MELPQDSAPSIYQELAEQSAVHCALLQRALDTLIQIEVETKAHCTVMRQAYTKRTQRLTQASA